MGSESGRRNSVRRSRVALGGADERGPRRPGTSVCATAAAAALLAGCASMPDSGDVTAVDATQRTDAQVRVFGVPPRDGARPEEILDGFLEALTSDDPEFSIAREYLTEEAADNWEPERSTTVLRDGPNRGRNVPGPAATAGSSTR